MARLRKNHRLKVVLRTVCLSGLLGVSLSMPARAQSDYNPQHELLRAIEHGDLEGLRIYESEGADVNVLDSFGHSPLLKAVSRGNVHVIRELIKLGALIDDPRLSHQVNPALHQAANLGRLGVLEVLVNSGAKLEDTSSDGSTALWEAIYAGNPAAAKWLISQGADPNGKTLQLNGMVKPLLIQAAHQGELEIVEALLDAGAVPLVSFRGWTPLMHAAVNGHLEVVKCFIKRGQSPEAATEAGWTPAMAAAAGGHTHVLEYLLSQGVVLRGRPGWKAILEAVYSVQPSNPADRREAVRYLLAQGASYEAKIQKNPGSTELDIANASGVSEWVLKLLPPNQTPDIPGRNGMTPLHWAAINQEDAQVNELIKRGANVNFAIQDTQRTALMLALNSNNASIAERLLAAGANVSHVDSDGQTVLFSAVNTPVLIPKLLAQGASLESRDHAGRTALHVAVDHSLPQAADALVKAGADPLSKDHAGNTPLSLALADGYDLMVAILGTRLDAATAAKAYQTLDILDPEGLRQSFYRYKSAQPTSAELFQTGEQDLKRGDLTGARQVLTLLITREPTHTEAYTRLAWVYLQLSEFARARQSAEQAVALNPTLPRAHMLLAHAQLFTGQTEAALIEYQHILASSGRLRAEYVRILKQDFKDFDEQGLVPKALERVQALF